MHLVLGSGLGGTGCGAVAQAERQRQAGLLGHRLGQTVFFRRGPHPAASGQRSVNIQERARGHAIRSAANGGLLQAPVGRGLKNGGKLRNLRNLSAYRSGLR